MATSMDALFDLMTALDDPIFCILDPATWESPARRGEDLLGALIMGFPNIIDFLETNGPVVPRDWSEEERTGTFDEFVLASPADVRENGRAMLEKIDGVKFSGYEGNNLQLAGKSLRWRQLYLPNEYFDMFKSRLNIRDRHDAVRFAPRWFRDKLNPVYMVVGVMLREDVRLIWGESHVFALQLRRVKQGDSYLDPLSLESTDFVPGGDFRVFWRLLNLMFAYGVWKLGEYCGSGESWFVYWVFIAITSYFILPRRLFS